MSNPANPPGREPGGIAADLANLGHLLDVLDSLLDPNLRPEVIRADLEWQKRNPDRVALGAERDSARSFLRKLADDGLPRAVWTRESADRLAASVADLLDALQRVPGVTAATPLRDAIDTRQPGAVPGPAPGDLPGAAFAFPAGHIPEPEPVNTTPEPAYRAPLEGTTPPEGREFRCDTCGRLFAGHVMAGCPCGGEITIVDPVPAPEHWQVRGSWIRAINSRLFHQEARGEILCSCGVMLHGPDPYELQARWEAHARVEGS